ncbi:putative chaperonin Cpn60/TCP-1 family, groEL-like equatorial domain superfamily [Helianthus anomalus]
MIELSRTQYEEVGDGTTSVIVLAGEMLHVAEAFIDKKYHPTREAVSEAQRRPFSSTLLGFWNYVQICHFVPITRRQVIARVGFRHCVQILNCLGF